MRLDTQNFSNITDIDTANQLKILLEIEEHDSPSYALYLNGFRVISPLLLFDTDLFSDISLVCDKHNSQGAIEIKNFTVNNKQVLPRYLHLASTPTHWISQEGSWHLSISAPFHTWYHNASGQGWIA